VIREATPADAPRLAELSQHFLDSTPYGQLLKPAPGMVEKVVDLVLEQGITFVAEVDGAIVGMVGALVLPHPVTGEDYLDEVAWWVEPEHRGGSVGPRLLRHMEGWAVTSGLHMVKMVAPAATDVGDFYQRMGYMAVETAWIKVL
jgi:GNAT superfamily N-acetyltransferase